MIMSSAARKNLALLSLLLILLGILLVAYVVWPLPVSSTEATAMPTLFLPPE